MDLVRTLLIKIADDPQFNGIGNPTLDPLDYVTEAASYADVDYHLRQLLDADMLNGEPMMSPGFIIRNVTWSGHDFLDTVRDPEIWARTKKGAAAAGGFTIDLLKDLAKGLVRKQIEDRTGVKL
nr:DUF2513 domain-containing protein [uncultured Rhodopila sp.]